METELRHGEIPTYGEYISMIDQSEAITIKMFTVKIQDADIFRAVGDVKTAETIEMLAAMDIATFCTQNDERRAVAARRHNQGKWA